MGPTRVQRQDPGLSGLPEILTAAHIQLHGINMGLKSLLHHDFGLHVPTVATMLGHFGSTSYVEDQALLFWGSGPTCYNQRELMRIVYHIIICHMVVRLFMEGSSAAAGADTGRPVQPKPFSA